LIAAIGGMGVMMMVLVQVHGFTLIFDDCCGSERCAHASGVSARTGFQLRR
jgi:hypothetical protein